jgi:Ser/Thr protein kinase RdoA (MazF antagonist)
LDVLKHLRQKNFPAAHPLPTRDGAYFFPVNAPEGVRYIALFTLAPGPEISYEVDPDQVATSYGQTVAEMHNALDDFYSPHPRFQLDLDYFTKQPLQYIEPFLRDRPEDWLYVKNFAVKLRQRLLDLPANQLELGFCHGDLQGYHANVSPDGTLTFYDFDCGGFGFRAYDLAVFLWCCRLEDAVSVRWNPFINAYPENRVISELDIQAIPLFVCARYLWHLGVHAQNSPDWGIDFLNKEYFKDHLGRLRKAEEDYLTY